MKKTWILAFLFLSLGAAFAAEKTGTVTQKTSSVDKKGKTEFKVYLDTTGNGIADTVLGMDIAAPDQKKNKPPKEEDAVVRELDALIKEGTRIVFDDRNATRPDAYIRITRHDLIAVDSVQLAQRFPNPYWFPFAYAKANN